MYIHRQKRMWCSGGTEISSVQPEPIEEGRGGMRLGCRESQGSHHMDCGNKLEFCY